MSLFFSTMQWHGVPWNAEMPIDMKLEALRQHIATESGYDTDADGEHDNYHDAVFNNDIVSVSHNADRKGSFKVHGAYGESRDELLRQVFVRLNELYETFEKGGVPDLRDISIGKYWISGVGNIDSVEEACEEWMRIWNDAVLIDDFNKARDDLERIAQYLESVAGNSTYLDCDTHHIDFTESPNGGRQWPFVYENSDQHGHDGRGGDAMCYERFNPTPWPDTWDRGTE